eukprot:SAG31_NODE_1383_length_8578_cov_3.660573_1_plen_64_part_00
MSRSSSHGKLTVVVALPAQHQQIAWVAVWSRRAAGQQLAAARPRRVRVRRRRARGKLKCTRTY